LPTNSPPSNWPKAFAGDPSAVKDLGVCIDKSPWSASFATQGFFTDVEIGGIVSIASTSALLM
jgi:hypothetical protein